MHRLLPPRLLTDLIRTTADDFVTNLLAFPSESDVITEAVHSVSSTIDSRHFAEEFIRRRKLADKGLVDNTHPHHGTGSPAERSEGKGGWSEVAKKGPQQAKVQDDTANANFRVVGGKKKGGKR